MAWDVAIVGAGPAGLMAAAQAAARGLRTLLLEKNREPGVKILLSGGTRCNLTHAGDARGIVRAFGSAGRFLHSALAALGPEAVVDLFAAEGVPTKVEPGGKVFPASDRAADVLAALVRRAGRSGCTPVFGEPLVELARAGDGFRLVTPQRSIEAGSVVLASGGRSYPACGTTGDGYAWAAAMGHRIVAPHEALTPVTSHASWVTALMGVTLPDVAVRVILPQPVGNALLGAAEAERQATTRERHRGRSLQDTELASARGSMLFAHFGVTGPAVLDISRAVSGFPNPASLVLRCDLLPNVTQQQLEARITQDVAASGRRRAATLLDPWLPHRVGLAVLALAGIPPDRPGAELSKVERRRLARTVKQVDVPAAGTMGFRKAEVTAGGVALKEVDSHSMQSRLVPHLYFAGELLDLDGPVGGYNFQAAFSTGCLAGQSVG